MSCILLPWDKTNTVLIHQTTQYVNLRHNNLTISQSHICNNKKKNKRMKLVLRVSNPAFVPDFATCSSEDLNVGEPLHRLRELREESLLVKQFIDNVSGTLGG